MQRERLAIPLTLLLLSGCASFATNLVADAMSGGGDSFGSDNDPELVRDAIPFGLKTMESLLAQTPDHTGLLDSLSSGFTQYANGFVQQEADFAQESDPDRARAQLERARKLYARAHDYALRSLESRHEGFRAALEKNPAKGAAMADDRCDVPRLYWAAASLALLVSNSKDDMALVGRLPQVEALIGQAIRLDPDWDGGTLHEFLFIYDGGRSEFMGGSLARAKEHFDRARALSKNTRAGLYVSWAEMISVQSQDRAEFEAMLQQALDLDIERAPKRRLANLIAQARARWLAARADELFL